MIAPVAAIGTQRDRRGSGGKMGVVRGRKARLASADGEAGFHAFAKTEAISRGSIRSAVEEDWRGRCGRNRAYQRKAQ